MSVILTMLLKEETRNANMISTYYEELAKLPKGTICQKKIKNKCYYYLTFRENGKVVTKYIGKNAEILNSIRERLMRRKQIEEIIKKLKDEKVQIKRMEAILWFYITAVTWL